MALVGAISKLLSLGDKLLPAVKAAQAPSSSSSPGDQNHQIEAELKKLMRMLKRIKATLYDAEQREIRDMAVKLWLKELQGVAYDAEDVLDEYHYEVLRAQVEAAESSLPDSRKRKLIQVPDGMFDHIQKIRNNFADIEKDRVALRLSEEDGPRRFNSEFQIAPTSHVIDPSSIFGRKNEKKKLIDLLSSESHDGKVVSVVTIVGTGGLGKTTLAQLVYNDQKFRQRFDKFGWVCVSEDFNVERLTREMVESITRKKCGLTNLSALQEEITDVIRDKRLLLVFDDVSNEKRSLWELLQAPFVSAAFAKILVTTRDKHVAGIIQTEPTFYLDYLSEECCWQLFEYYAFGVNHSEASNLVQIGKKIVKKCGMLPLAVKSIASLLRHEAQEESWREILESKLWESNASNEIFPPLQLSYTRLPTYLRPCLIYCSMFPKDYCYSIKKMVRLWISQGYIESTEKKNAEEIGWEYAKQLWQRSLITAMPWEDEICSLFKLHDMIHDLARCNFENGCCSIEDGMTGQIPAFPTRQYHLYVDGFVKLMEPVLFDNFTTLRTLVTRGFGVKKLSAFDLLVAQKLRALKIECHSLELEFFSSLGKLKHLRYLSLGGLPFERLPECICSLYNLQILKLGHCAFNELPTKIGNLVSLENLLISRCYDLRVLPESLCQLKALRNLNFSWCNQLERLPTSIGNLVSLEKMEIKHYNLLKGLPESLCQLKALKELILFDCKSLEVLPSDVGSLTNLKTLEIHSPGVGSLPPSWDKIIRIQKLGIVLDCETIGWLKDFGDLGGTLSISGLNNVSRLIDFMGTNLLSMPNLECLHLCWNYAELDGYGFSLFIKRNQNTFFEYQNDSSVMASLQPHPNLRELRINGYGSITFAEWIGNPISCASLERIVICDCKNLTFLPFGSLYKLKYLNVSFCDSLQFLRAESLPLELQELEVFECSALISVPGIQKLKSLVKLSIIGCGNLQWLLMNAEPSVAPMMHTDKSSSPS